MGNSYGEPYQLAIDAVENHCEDGSDNRHAAEIRDAPHGIVLLRNETGQSLTSGHREEGQAHHLAGERLWGEHSGDGQSRRHHQDLTRSEDCNRHEHDEHGIRCVFE